MKIITKRNLTLHKNRTGRCQSKKVTKKLSNSIPFMKEQILGKHDFSKGFAAFPICLGGSGIVSFLILQLKSIIGNLYVDLSRPI